MFRSFSLLTIAAFLIPGFAGAADWQKTTFPVKNHDFGSVAVAAKTEFRFPVVNGFSSNIHIQSVRASCGCTTPFVETPYITPGQTGTIRARFNTDTFRGKKGATLTVIMDQPFYSEIRLRVDGYIRSDIVFHPGSLEFGTVNRGDTLTRSSKLMYAGRNDWKVVDLRSNQPWLVPSFKQVSRTNGRIDYELQVKVREDAPTGYFQDEVTILTNDRSMPRVPLRVAGQVESALSISPQAIALGRLKPGESVDVRLVLKGREPFTIKSIECEGWDVKCAPTPVAKATHLTTATFTPQDISGQQKVAVVITTDGRESVQAKAVLTAEVRDQ
jgi:hypothetical protein